MSTTTMYLFEAPNWDAKPCAEFGNSWGFAAFIWDSLLVWYERKIPNLETVGGRPTSGPKNWAKLWEHEREIPFEPWEKVVLRLTYDRAIIHVGQFAQVAACLRKFERKYYCPALDGDCHLSAIASKLDELLQSIYNIPRGMAVGFQVTSVAQDLWHFYDDEAGGYQPYDLKTHKLHHVLETVP